MENEQYRPLQGGVLHDNQTKGQEHSTNLQALYIFCHMLPAEINVMLITMLSTSAPDNIQ